MVINLIRFDWASRKGSWFWNGSLRGLNDEADDPMILFLLLLDFHHIFVRIALDASISLVYILVAVLTLALCGSLFSSSLWMIHVFRCVLPFSFFFTGLRCIFLFLMILLCNTMNVVFLCALIVVDVTLLYYRHFRLALTGPIGAT